LIGCIVTIWRKTTSRSNRKTPNNPRYKYNFKENLKDVGDYIETFPLSEKDAFNFKIAADMWSWRNAVTFQVNGYRQADGTRIVRVTLVKKHRERDYS
jgi:hypothetical protein